MTWIQMGARMILMCPHGYTRETNPEQTKNIAERFETALR